VERREGLLLIGGASRNVGKTTLICKIIEHFSKNHSVVGLKIKSIYDGDSYFHGKESKKFFDKYLLTEESESESNDDTHKMLKAGAHKAFLLRTKSEFLSEAFLYFVTKINDKDLIICESNSLRRFYEPDIYLFIKDKNGANMKPSAQQLEIYADRIIFSDGIKHDFDVNELQIENAEWKLVK